MKGFDRMDPCTGLSKIVVEKPFKMFKIVLRKLLLVFRVLGCIAALAELSDDVL